MITTSPSPRLFTGNTQPAPMILRKKQLPAPVHFGNDPSEDTFSRDDDAKARERLAQAMTALGGPGGPDDPDGPEPDEIGYYQDAPLAIRVGALKPTHPFAPFKREEAEQVAKIHNRQYGNQVIVMSPDEDLREGLLTAVLQQVLAEKGLELDDDVIKTVTDPTEALYDYLDQGMSFDDAQDRLQQNAVEYQYAMLQVPRLDAESFTERVPQKLYVDMLEQALVHLYSEGVLQAGASQTLVIDHVSPSLQAALTEGHDFETLMEQLPDLKIILNVDSTEVEEDIDPMTEMMRRMTGQGPEKRHRRSFSSVQGMFRLVEPKPLDVKDFIGVVQNHPKTRQILKGWGITISDKNLEYLLGRMKEYSYSKTLSIRQICEVLDSVGQKVDDLRQKNPGRYEQPTPVTKRWLQDFVRDVVKPDIIGLQDVLSKGPQYDIQPYSVRKNPFNGLRMDQARQIKSILFNRTRIRNVVIQGDRKELNIGLLNDLRKAIPRSAAVFRLDFETRHVGSDFVSRLPVIARQLEQEAAKKGKNTKNYPITLVLDNVSYGDFQTLTSDAFAKIEKRIPNLRLVVNRVTKGDDDMGGNPFMSMFGFSMGGRDEEKPKWYQGRFETVKVTDMSTEDWSSWLANEKEIQDALKEAQASFTAKAGKLFLGILQLEYGKAKLDKEDVLAELDSILAYARSGGSKGPLEVDENMVRQFTNRVIRKRGPMERRKRGGVGATPYDVYMPGEITRSFKDVIGLPDVKDSIQKSLNAVQYPNIYKQLYAEDDDGLSNLIVFVGDPGNGKTLTAAASAGESGFSLLSTTGSRFVNMYVGMGANNMRLFFDALEDGMIAYIDEADTALPNRDRKGHSDAGTNEDDRTVNEFLAQTEGVDEDPRRVLFILGTNHLKKLDPAVVSRAHEIIQFNDPNFDERILHFQFHMDKKHLVPQGTIDYERLSRMLDGQNVSGRDIRNIMIQVKKAAIAQALPSDPAQLEALEHDPERIKSLELPVTQDLLESTIKHYLEVDRPKQSATGSNVSIGQYL